VTADPGFSEKGRKHS